jgi:multiple sugar transport system permease protein
VGRAPARSRWLWNTFYYAILSGVGAVLLSALAGYALSKYEFVGKRFIYAMVLGAVMIPQTALVIPLFLLFSAAHVLNTPWAVILPSLVFPQGVFLMRAYIDDAVSGEIVDAGRMDGAGEFRIFWLLAFRLVTPATSHQPSRRSAADRLIYRR